MKALVLNASYEPLGVVTDRRALLLVLNNRATVVEDSDVVYRHFNGEIRLPSVIRLTKFIKIPFRHGVPLSRRAVFARDGGQCVYCNAVANSLDHLIPRSRGGMHTWENIVAACSKCNFQKADKTLKELGWKLANPPREPKGAAWRILGTGKAEKKWLTYLQPYGDDSFGNALESA